MFKNDQGKCPQTRENNLRGCKAAHGFGCPVLLGGVAPPRQKKVSPGLRTWCPLPLPLLDGAYWGTAFPVTPSPNSSHWQKGCWRSWGYVNEESQHPHEKSFGGKGQPEHHQGDSSRNTEWEQSLPKNPILGRKVIPSPARMSPLMEIQPPPKLQMFLIQITNDLWLDSESEGPIHDPHNVSNRNFSKKV